jgi:AbrB family looped-hinge helix DNA binding protein
MDMKKYPKLIQCDKRGQIVIPKDIRNELKIDEGTGFWMYSITDEGILLKKIDVPELSEQRDLINTIANKSDKIDIKPKNIIKSVDDYKKKKDGNLDVI